jgi:RNA polymerase sigma-70 factor (ECF subfamily)
MSPPVDDAVIAAAKSGDEGAWRELYGVLGGRLMGWLRTQPSLDASLDAEDLANEAWLTAARRVNEFNGSMDDFAGWIFVIARNLALNASRRSLRRATTPTALDPRELVGEQDSIDEGAEVDSREWIGELLGILSKRERDVVACIDIAGLDVARTARVLGIGRSAVRVAHHRAMKRLQAMLTESKDLTGHRGTAKP